MGQMVYEIFVDGLKVAGMDDEKSVMYYAVQYVDEGVVTVEKDGTPIYTLSKPSANDQ